MPQNRWIWDNCIQEPKTVNTGKHGYVYVISVYGKENMLLTGNEVCKSSSMNLPHEPPPTPLPFWLKHSQWPMPPCIVSSECVLFIYTQIFLWLLILSAIHEPPVAVKNSLFNHVFILHVLIPLSKTHTHTLIADALSSQSAPFSLLLCLLSCSRFSAVDKILYVIQIHQFNSFFWLATALNGNSELAAELPYNAGVKYREHVINWEWGSPNWFSKPLQWTIPHCSPKGLNSQCHHVLDVNCTFQNYFWFLPAAHLWAQSSSYIFARLFCVNWYSGHQNHIDQQIMAFLTLELFCKLHPAKTFCFGTNSQTQQLINSGSRVELWSPSQAEMKVFKIALL